MARTIIPTDLDEAGQTPLSPSPTIDYQKLKMLAGEVAPQPTSVLGGVSGLLAPHAQYTAPPSPQEPVSIRNPDGSINLGGLAVGGQPPAGSGVPLRNPDGSINYSGIQNFFTGGQGYDPNRDPRQEATLSEVSIDARDQLKRAQELYDREFGAAQIRDPKAIVNQEIAVPDLGPTERARQTTIAPIANASKGTDIAADVGKTATVQRTGFDATQSDQSRAAQLKAAELAMAQAEGKGVSAASDEFAADLAQAARTRLGVASSGTGRTRAALKRNAAQGIGQDAMQAAKLAAATRSRDAQAGAQNLLQASTALRSTDVDVAAKRADLDARASELQAQLENAMASGNRDAINSIRLRQKELEQERNMFNAGSFNQRNLAQSQLDQDLAKFNALETNKRTLDQAALSLDASKNNAANRLTADSRNVENTLSRDAKQGDLDQGAFTATTGAKVVGANAEDAAIRNKADIAKARHNTNHQAVQNDATRDQMDEDRNWKIGAQVVAGLGALALSDERVKRDVKSLKVSPEELKELADELAGKAKTWRYKEGYEDGGEEVHKGWMAQDLEKMGRLGKSVVSETEDGTKAVDYGRLSMLLDQATMKGRKQRAGTKDSRR